MTWNDSTTSEAAEEAADGAVGEAEAADGDGSLQPAASGATTIASHRDAERMNRLVPTLPSECALTTTSITRVGYQQVSDGRSSARVLRLHGIW